MSEQAVVNIIIELEKARCRALEEADYGALDALLDDALVHIHSTGQIDDKRGYLGLIERAIKFLRVERQDLQVSIFANVAVATGHLLQSIELCGTGEQREMNLVTTQVWLCRDSTWRLINFHATNL
ncbi:nuclear transport factor 2 family protein [Pseudomonas sp. MAFF 301449]|uniref:Nuclear transport factor 2 family protein n=1 Tax=Pseudomonas cyclaminis TaxID=2781239 RepID=A0ABR9SRI0_9PSED|nr:nuclear transport factor 2 family protein [Pseudomonas cyclaminis]MBE8590929.1 nuclear transport factor 2 family protein [Pseudomonas cyclaminis]MBE8598633.1 nuclear transport factor 2 family protein [Pseudomonas cyclaminis]